MPRSSLVLLAPVIMLLACDGRSVQGSDAGPSVDMTLSPRGDGNLHTHDVIPAALDSYLEPPDAPRPDAFVPNKGPPPPPPPTPSPCKAGQRMWCDGLVYSGWGQVECDPATGMWKAKVVNGKTYIDCRESLAGGKVPATPCACYHFFFNPACCETPGCVVPAGSSGQICPPSPGELCDYCNPLNPGCKPDAKCIVTNSHESFCGQSCESAPCPAGFNCMSIKLKTGDTTQQCVPADLSCFH